MKINIADSWKILDFDSSSVSWATLQFLQNFMAYIDPDNDEHLVSVYSALDYAKNERGEMIVSFFYEQQVVIIDELEQLQKLTEKHNAFYIRFIN